MSKIAIIQSLFNDDITTMLSDHAIKYLQNYSDLMIKDVTVPGSVELPLAATYCAQAGYDGVILLGCVIKGGTDHYHYVSEQASQGCQQVMLQYVLPVVFGVLTTHTKQDAMDRANGVVCNSGVDCAKALLQMLALKKEIAIEAECNFLSVKNVVYT